MDEREILIEIAKAAEQVERYDDMAAKMKKVVELGDALSSEERNLLSVAYKNKAGRTRSAYRILSSHLERDPQNADEVLKAYLSQIDEELKCVSAEILNLLDNYLIADETDDYEAKVFYLKMKGDYYRYLTEIASGEKRQSLAKSSENAYNQAYVLSSNELRAYSPIHLGLSLNYSVLYYEVLNRRKEACDLAKKAFDDAIAELDSVPEYCYKDSTMIIQLLRDNITLWSSETTEDGEEH